MELPLSFITHKKTLTIANQSLIIHLMEMFSDFFLD